MEEGISLIGFLINPDGTVGRTVVFSSSGSVDLDRSAQSTLERCTFKPATKDGTRTEQWVQVLYGWEHAMDPGMTRAKRELSAKAGDDPDARYQLSLVMGFNAKTDKDRERSHILALSAAEQGQPHAQYEMGRYYERAAPKDLETAMSWYRKAAAQGDVLAIQRLEKGAEFQ